MQKSAFITVPRADLLKVHPVVRCLFVTMPEIRYKTLCCILPRVGGHQKEYSDLSNTQIQTYAIFLNSWWFMDNHKCSDPSDDPKDDSRDDPRDNPRDDLISDPRDDPMMIFPSE